MNAAGLKFTLTSVAEIINSPVWFDRLTGEGISAGELKGTRQEATAIVNALKATPNEKIESLVAHYDGVLTSALQTFQGNWQLNFLQGFRDAQVMIGFVTSLLNKAGIRT
jgi:hypothetical protein